MKLLFFGSFTKTSSCRISTATIHNHYVVLRLTKNSPQTFQKKERQCQIFNSRGQAGGILVLFVGAAFRRNKTHTKTFLQTARAVPLPKSTPFQRATEDYAVLCRIFGTTGKSVICARTNSRLLSFLFWRPDLPALVDLAFHRRWKGFASFCNGECSRQ